MAPDEGEGARDKALAGLAVSGARQGSRGPCVALLICGFEPLWEGKMGISSLSLVVMTLMSLIIFTLGDESMAQTSPSKVGTRLITLGTIAGPPPRAHRA